MDHLPCRCTTAMVTNALLSCTQRPSERWDSHTSQSLFLLASLLFTSLCRICVATSNSDTKRCWQVTWWATCFILMKQIHWTTKSAQSCDLSTNWTRSARSNPVRESIRHTSSVRSSGHPPLHPGRLRQHCQLEIPF